MSDEGEALRMVLAGGIGYLLGQGESKEWKPVIDQYKKRLLQLTLTQVPIPLAFIKRTGNIQMIFRESVYSYLFGLPDACLPTLIRVLELALKMKYEEVEKKKPPLEMDLAKLIGWAESVLKEKTNVAHSFRMMRNFIHTDRLIQEQDCLEALRHISLIIADLFPGQFLIMDTVCPHCNFSGITSLDPSQGFLGVSFSLQCGSCHRVYNWMVMP